MGPKLKILKYWISSPCRDEEIGTDFIEIDGWNCNFLPGWKPGQVRVAGRAGHAGRRVAGQRAGRLGLCVWACKARPRVGLSVGPHASGLVKLSRVQACELGVCTARVHGCLKDADKAC